MTINRDTKLTKANLHKLVDATPYLSITGRRGWYYVSNRLTGDSRRYSGDNVVTISTKSQRTYQNPTVGYAIDKIAPLMLDKAEAADIARAKAADAWVKQQAAMRELRAATDAVDSGAGTKHLTTLTAAAQRVARYTRAERSYIEMAEAIEAS